jgi:signal transduction histidine kinase
MSDCTPNKVAFLRNLPLFVGLDGEQLESAARAATEVHLPCGETLFHKGDPADAIYIIVDGSVRIHDGEFTLTYLPAFTSFGESCITAHPFRTASATASAATKLLKLALNSRCFPIEQNPTFLRAIVSILFKRISEKDILEGEIQLNLKEIRRQRDELLQINNLKNKLFTVIAHDLRSPLESLSWLTGWASKSSDRLTKEKLAESLDYIHGESQSAGRLLENLLDWARSQSHQIQLNPKSVNLFEVVDESLESIAGSAKRKGVALWNEIPKDTSVTADRNTLATIARNLISNAVKFTQNGGRVRISATEAGEKIVWCTTDNGIGIAPERLALLLASDTHSSTHGTANEKGTGLGLKLCREFAERNRGTIHVSSEPSRGTCVTVTLPGRAPQPPA